MFCRAKQLSAPTACPPVGGRISQIRSNLTFRPQAKPILIACGCLENQSDGLNSQLFSRIEVLTPAHQCSPRKPRAILMASKASPPETRGLWARAAQARRVAGMLSPRDAQLAEAYALECEDQAREACLYSLRPGRSSVVQCVADPASGSLLRISPKEVVVSQFEIFAAVRRRPSRLEVSGATA
jgi:hypothetical protein